MLVNHDGKSPIIGYEYYTETFMFVTDLYPPSTDLNGSDVVRDELNIFILTGNLDADL